MERTTRTQGGNDSSLTRWSNRRQFLKTSLVTAGAATIAGCSIQFGDSEIELNVDNAPTAEEVNTPTDTSSNSSDSRSRGGTLVYGLSGEPDGANPMTTLSVFSWVALDLVYPGGVRFDPVTFELRPHVWSDWVVEPGSTPDIYWNVRQDLQWNDGSPLTISDVVFSYNYINDHPASVMGSRASPIDTVEAADRSDWDLHMRLSEPTYNWEMELLGLPLLPESQWRGRDPETFDPMNTEVGPIGLGPGELTTYQPNRMVVEFTNDHYSETLGALDWIQDHEALVGGGPFLDAIEFQVYNDQAALTQAFLNGELDAFHGSLEQADAEQAATTDELGVVSCIEGGYSYIGFNLRRTPMDDLSFRQAITFCHDESFLVDQLKAGRAFKGDVPHSIGYRDSRPETVFGGELGSDPALDAFAFRGGDDGRLNVEDVRAFLTNGQVIDGFAGTFAGQSYPGSLSGVSTSLDGPMHNYQFATVTTSVLQDHGADAEIYINGQTIPELLGRPLRVLSGPQSEIPDRYRAARDWVTNLRELGIPIELQEMDLNPLINRVFNAEDFDIYMASWASLDPLGGSLPELFHSDSADDHSDGEESAILTNPLGYGLFDYASADDMLDQVQTAMEPRSRREIGATVMEAIYLDCPIYVTHVDRLAVPLNSRKWTGFIEDIVHPTLATWKVQVENVRSIS